MQIRKPSCLLAAIAAFGNLFVSSESWAAAVDCSGTKKSKHLTEPTTEPLRVLRRPFGLSHAVMADSVAAR